MYYIYLDQPKISCQLHELPSLEILLSLLQMPNVFSPPFHLLIKKTIITIYKEGNIFMLGICLKPYSQGLVASFSSTLNLDTIKQHHHLGHLNIKSLNTMHFHNMVIGLLHLNIFSSFVKVVFLKNILNHHIQLHWSPKPLNLYFRSILMYVGS